MEIRNSSSEEDILSADYLENAGDELDHHDNEELASTFDLPG